MTDGALISSGILNGRGAWRGAAFQVGSSVGWQQAAPGNDR
jgi:hypothetical protein